MKTEKKIWCPLLVARAIKHKKQEERGVKIAKR